MLSSPSGRASLFFCFFEGNHSIDWLARRRSRHNRYSCGSAASLSYALRSTNPTYAARTLLPSPRPGRLLLYLDWFVTWPTCLSKAASISSASICLPKTTTNRSAFPFFRHHSLEPRHVLSRKNANSAPAKFVSSSFWRMARHTLSFFVCDRDGPLSVQFYPFTTTTRFSSSFSISSIGALFASPSRISSFPEKRLFGPLQSASACPMSFYLCDSCRQLPACLFEPHPPPILVVQLFPRLAAFSGTIFFTCNNLSNASSVLPVPLAPSLLWPTNDLSFCRLCCP